MEPALHEDVRPLAFLLGRWAGSGEGVWPPGEAFRYREEMTFEHEGDAFLLYAQRSWSAGGDEPLHFERGFFRPGGEGRVEVTLAHPLGIVEVAEGAVSPGLVEVTSTAVALTSTGSPVTGLRRRIEVTDDVLRYELWMALRDGAPTRHLVGELERV
jgi:THAP4-like, heme-binding beta-barrel domain